MAAHSGPDDLVAGPHQPFGDHPQIEAWAVMGDQQCGQFRLAEPHADPEACHARLRDLELRLADPIAIADADLVIAETFDGEVLAELAELEVVAAEVVLPVAVGLDLVDQDGPLLAAVPVQVALAVSVDVEPAHHPRPLDCVLPDSGVHGAVLHRTSFGRPTLTDSRLAMVSLLSGRRDGRSLSRSQEVLSKQLSRVAGAARPRQACLRRPSSPC